VVRLLVEMLAPHENARVYDPCCGSGGMFVQSESFVEMHGGRRGSVSIYGQESNPTTWRMAVMNLATRGIEAHIAQGDTFTVRETIEHVGEFAARCQRRRRPWKFRTAPSTEARTVKRAVWVAVWVEGHPAQLENTVIHRDD
jgi:hypothetical protein